MQDDAIAAALHVAADAMFMEAAPDEAPLAADCMEAHAALVRQAAAAIEAFHMKLATYYRGHGIEPTAMFHDSMAAAVARAAKGGA